MIYEKNIFRTFKKRRLKKRSLGKKVHGYFASYRWYLNKFISQIKWTISDFLYHLKHQLTSKSVKERTFDGIVYLKEKASNFSDNVSCLRTRIEVHANMRRKKKHLSSYGHPYYDNYIVKRAVDSMDDCFEEMREPLYGFRTKITSEKQCGIDGLECDLSNSATTNNNTAERRQTGEEFASDAPPDCRIVDQCS